MSELRAVLDLSAAVTGRGEDAILATVVKVEGSAYRRPGARLLVTQQGDSVGGVSGGCLEGDLVRKAWWRTAAGPCLVTYDASADDDTVWRFGLGCNGVVHVLLERVTPAGPDPLAFARQCLAGGEPGVLATAFRADAATGVSVGERLTLTAGGRCVAGWGSAELTDAVRAAAEACLAGDRTRTETYAVAAGEVEVCVEVVRPPVRVVVFGAGFDAVPVVRAAKALGWDVTVVDRRPAFARRAAAAEADALVADAAGAACDRVRLDGRTAVVVMGHNYPDDRAALAAVLPSAARYVGVLGPRSRTDRMLADLASAGVRPTATQLGRLYGPVGLDVGADTPAEIAAAVVGQIVAVFAGRPGGHLRDRPGPIHRREPHPVEAGSGP